MEAVKDSSPEFSNALAPMVSNASPVKITRLKDVQDLKASLSIYVTLSGRIISSNLLEAKFN